MNLHIDLKVGTIVAFAGGSLTEPARIVFAASGVIVTDRIPFHPESLSWPDQPGAGTSDASARSPR